jgi:hypothetical protein
MDEGQVIALINSAFADVPRPAKESITNCTCEECLEIRDDFAEQDPDDMDADRMRYHSWDMTFLTFEARHYFLPGWMRLGIRQPELAYSDAVIELLLRGEGRMEEDRGWEESGLYTPMQRKAILAFLDLVRTRNGERHDEDLEAAWTSWSEHGGESENEESEQAGSSNGGNVLL